MCQDICSAANCALFDHLVGEREERGLQIFVKLWQFDHADRTHVRIDSSERTWLDAKERDGVKLIPLFKDSREGVRLEQWVPAAAIDFDPDGGLELLVLQGGFSEGGETFGPQSWLRLPIGAHFSARVSADGRRPWIKEGHLRYAHEVWPTE